MDLRDFFLDKIYYIEFDGKIHKYYDYHEWRQMIDSLLSTNIHFEAWKVKNGLRDALTIRN